MRLIRTKPKQPQTDDAMNKSGDSVRLASIDIGSNSVLFLMTSYEKFELDDKTKVHHFKVIADEYDVTRLSQGIQPGYAISEDALMRTERALKKYRDKARGMEAISVFVAGTEAIRKASNRDEVIERLEEAVESHLHMVTGDEEAALSFSSVASEIPLSERNVPLLVFDIGGASTELYCSDHKEILFTRSLPVGSVKITEQCLEHDPPTDHELDSARKVIRQTFAQHLKPLQNLRAIGVAGTIATLSAFELKLPVYERTRAHGFTLQAETIHNQIDTLKRMTIAERRELTGLDPRRADVILGGALIAEHLIQFFKLSHIQFFDRGIRFGHLYQRLGLLSSKTCPVVTVSP